MIDGQNFFHQPVRNNLRIYDNIQKMTTGQGNDYATGCLLDYSYFNKHYKMIVIDLKKQPALDADPKAIQQINFTGNLVHENNDGQNVNDNTTMFFIIQEAKENLLDFLQGTVTVL